MWMEKDSELWLVNKCNACTYIHTCMPASTHAPTTVISNRSAPSHWPKAVSESFSQAAITDLSILQGRRNLFSILHFVCSSDKELWRSTKVTKIKQLVSDRVRVRKKTDLVPSGPFHSAYLECLSHTHPKPLLFLALGPDHLISYHLILAATRAPLPFAFRKFSIPWHKRAKRPVISYPWS